MVIGIVGSAMIVLGGLVLYLGIRWMIRRQHEQFGVGFCLTSGTFLLFMGIVILLALFGVLS